MTGLSIGTFPFGVQVFGGPSPLVPVVPVVTLPIDLPTAVERAMAESADLEEAIGRPAGGEDGWLWPDAPPSDVPLPFVVLSLLDETTPGESADDERSPLLVTVYGKDQLQSKTVGRSIRDFIAPGPHRDPLEWQGGREIGNIEADMLAERVPRIGYNGTEVYLYHIRYEFFTEPTNE